MRPSTLLAIAMGAPMVAADYMCPASMSKSDISALKFGYKVQALLEDYYNMIPVNASFFDGLPMANMKGMNGDTKAENTVANLMGLSKQAELGSKAIVESVKSITGDENMMPPKCDYNFPDTPDGMTHLKHAFFLEASMCGTFIGLADYVQSPEAAFLMARLSAEHGIHASALRAQMQDVGFMANSSSLTPAFTPDTVMMKTDMKNPEVGKLGNWLNGCAKSIDAPCGGMVKIGKLGAELMDQSGNKDQMCDGMHGDSDDGDDQDSSMNGNGNMSSGEDTDMNGDGDSDSGTEEGSGDNNNTPVTAGVGRVGPTTAVSLLAVAFAMMM